MVVAGSQQCSWSLTWPFLCRAEDGANEGNRRRPVAQQSHLDNQTNEFIREVDGWNMMCMQASQRPLNCLAALRKCFSTMLLLDNIQSATPVYIGNVVDACCHRIVHPDGNDLRRRTIMMSGRCPGLWIHATAAGLATILFFAGG